MKYKLFSKRGLALIVSLMMCLSAMSTTAWAGNFTQLQDKIDKSEDGNVVLDENYSYNEEEDGDRKSITINKDIDLNLNGNTITGSGNTSVIKVENGGDLTLRDEKADAPETAETDSDEEPEPEKVGTITGGGGQTGGGIKVENGGKLTMDGGTITQNHVTEHSGYTYGGGGVFVDGGGKFIMNDGTITDNKSYGSGAGVYVADNADFTMNGGSISQNTSTDGEGGGVHVNGSFVMNEGSITDNTSNKNEGGGGVRVWNGQFTMNGGAITGNTANNATDDLQSIAASDHGDPRATINAGTVGSDAEKYISDDACHYTDDGTTITVPNHTWEDATCTTPKTCAVCGKIDGNPNDHKWESVAAKPATCTEDGHEAGQKCANCEATTGLKTIPALKHTWDAGVVTTEPTTTSPGVKTFTCTRESCGATRTEEIPALEPTEPTEPTEPDDGNTPDVPVLPETPELPDDGPDVPDGAVTIPDEDVPLGGEPAAAPVTIADEAVPLAGLLSLAQLLDELYRHEDRPAVDLPEGFPFASHEYAPAICWALDNALVVNTEAEPLDPDELLTVGLLRKVLTNYALLKGQEDFVVELTGEDDDLVLDLGERLTVFYAQLEAAE